jgi:hypothetical protein
MYICAAGPMLNYLSTTPWWRMRNGCIGPCFLALGTSSRWMVNFTPRPLYSWGKSPHCPMDRMLGVPQGRSGLYAEIKSVDITGTRTKIPLYSSRTHPIYRLLYCGYTHISVCTILEKHYVRAINTTFYLVIRNFLRDCVFHEVRNRRSLLHH